MVLLYTMNILSTTKNNKCSNTFYGNLMQERKAAVGRTEGRMVCRACDTQCGRGMTSTLQVFDFHHAFVGLTPLLCPSQTNQIKIFPHHHHHDPLTCVYSVSVMVMVSVSVSVSVSVTVSIVCTFCICKKCKCIHLHTDKKFVYKSARYFAPQNFMV